MYSTVLNRLIRLLKDESEILDSLIHLKTSQGALVSVDCQPSPPVKRDKGSQGRGDRETKL